MKARHSFSGALILFFILVNVFTVGAQKKHLISGTVSDELGTPLSNASVLLNACRRGTVTNAIGEFEIVVPANCSSDTLVISMLGYSTARIALTQVLPPSLQVRLETRPIQLKEVVFDDEISTEEILKNVHSNVTKNYSSDEFVLNGFYREVQKVDSQYVSLVEAVVNVFSDGFDTKKQEKIEIQQLRRSVSYRNSTVPFWDTRNLLISFLSQNFVKYKKRSLIKHLDAVRKEDTFIDGIRVYVIDLNERPDFWLNTLFIRSDNFAIIRFEENFDVEGDPPRRWTVDNNPMVEAHPQYKKLEVNFKAIDGKYYVSHCSMSFRSLYKDKLTKKLLLDFQIDHKFVVTEWITENRPTLDPEKVLNAYTSLEEMPINYDSAFWNSYSPIKEAPLDEQIRQDLEKEVKLEKQFEGR